MTKMTKNGYEDYLKELANRLHTEKNFTLKDFNMLADKVEILDFDLSMYNIPSQIKEKINAYFFNEELRNNQRTFCGHVSNNSQLYRLVDILILKFKNYGYSGYAYNDKYKMILSHCEGDIYLKIFTSIEEYQTELESTKKWFKENY